MTRTKSLHARGQLEKAGAAAVTDCWTLTHRGVGVEKGSKVMRRGKSDSCLAVQRLLFLVFFSALKNRRERDAFPNFTVLFSPLFAKEGDDEKEGGEGMSGMTEKPPAPAAASLTPTMPVETVAHLVVATTETGERDQRPCHRTGGPQVGHQDAWPPASGKTAALTRDAGVSLPRPGRTPLFLGRRLPPQLLQK